MQNSEIKNMAVIGLKLFLICAISAVSLSVLNIFTQEPIANHKVEAENEVRDKFVEIFKTELNLNNCEAGSKTELTAAEKEQLLKKGIEYVSAFYKVTNNGKIIGYIVELAGKGYGGYIKVMALYKSDGEIVSAKLMDNDETPGLGKKAEDDSYMNKFIGTGSRDIPVPVTKEMLAGSGGDTVQYRRDWAAANLSFGEWFFGKSEGSTDSVTGATITFNGVSSALASGALYVRTLEGGI